MAELREVQTQYNCSLTSKFYLTEDRTILIADFDGVAGIRSEGNACSFFIYCKLAEYLIYFTPHAIVLDFRDLEYSWGNSIMRVFQVTEDVLGYGEPPYRPIILVVSDKCKAGFASLLRFNPDQLAEFVFEDLDKAVEYAQKQGNEWIDR